MKLSAVKLASFAALLTPVIANFDVYMVDAYERVFKTHSRGWQIFDAQPSCDQVKLQRSGGATAINIDILEMNFSSLRKVWHWTLYKDRGFSMVGLDGNTYGNCIAFPNGDYDCDTNNGAQTLHGYRKFRCLTQYTVNDIFS
ncbi:hypothetical protein H4I96_11151 [Botrytis cinerea]